MSTIEFLLFISFFLSLIYLWKLIPQFKRRRLWNKVKFKEFPVEWDEILTQRYQLYGFLNQTEKSKLKQKILYFLEDKEILPLGDFVVTDEMKLLVAAQACLMILNLGQEVYPGLKLIYLMEDTFIPKNNLVDKYTGLPKYSPELGEQIKGGPIILSWPAVENGLRGFNSQNVVYHEFAHNLDQLDGGFDGTPPLKSSNAYGRWAQVMSREFFELKQNILHHHKSDIDIYGATNEAEFFAVLTEYFFIHPKFLAKKHPEIYEIFKNYFNLDPNNWQTIQK